MSIFSATLPLLDFYGWKGNSITISTALVNDMRGGIFTPAKDIRTSENVESHYIDNQTMCISIPRWNLWFELKEHQIAP